MVPRPPFPEIARRRLGTIKSVHTPGAYHDTPDYAFFVDQLTNAEIFGHKSQLRPGVYFAVGRRYWFTLGTNHKDLQPSTSSSLERSFRGRAPRVPGPFKLTLIAERNCHEQPVLLRGRESGEAA